MDAVLCFRPLLQPNYCIFLRFSLVLLFCCYQLTMSTPELLLSACWVEMFALVLERPKWRLIDKGRSWANVELSAKCVEGERKKKVSPLPFAAPICSESAGGVLFTVLCMCEERGAGRKEGQWEGGSGEMEGLGMEERREGEDSWWSLLKGIMGEERIAMAAM